jgi:hypothetical protein
VAKRKVKSISRQEQSNIPNKASPIGHASHRADRATSIRELERPAWFPQPFVQAILINSIVPSARIYKIAVRAPTSAHTERWDATRWFDCGDGVGLATIPDAQGAVKGGVQEGGFRLGD